MAQKIPRIFYALKPQKSKISDGCQSYLNFEVARINIKAFLN